MIAHKWGISREAMEKYALESHLRAQAAIDQGWFKNEIAPVGDFAVDETVRGNSTLAGLAALKPVREGGIITAGIASQNCDAAACLLIASRDRR